MRYVIFDLEATCWEKGTTPSRMQIIEIGAIIMTRDVEQVRNASTLNIAAKLGRDGTKKLRSDREAIKANVRRRALEAKVTQHGELRSLLV